MPKTSKTDSAGPSTPHDGHTTWPTTGTIKQNIRNMRFNLTELSGSFGDLGSFIPLSAGMAFTVGMDLGLILIFAGLCNVFAGVLFGLPIPVQPMKAIAAVAIAEGLLPGEVAAAGLITGAVMLILGVTNLVSTFERFVPLAVVRGIQLGIGVILMQKAVGLVRGTSLLGWDSVSLAVGLTVLMVLTRKIRRFPGALFLFVFGVFIVIHNVSIPAGAFSIAAPRFFLLIPSGAQCLTGFLDGAVPQIPLTILNSVFAVCVLSGDLFPGRRISSPATAASVGLINLVTCWFGAMPMCHGSGGLAGQYYFGARTGGSMVMIGVLKLLVGILFGSAAAFVIGAFPFSILGVMLLFAGLELAMPARDQIRTRNIVVVAVTAGGIVAVNTLAGFLAGTAVALLLRVRNPKTSRPDNR